MNSPLIQAPTQKQTNEKCLTPVLPSMPPIEEIKGVDQNDPFPPESEITLPTPKRKVIIISSTWHN